MKKFVKMNSNSIASSIHYSCLDCGKKALKLPENKGKKQFTISTMYNGHCDVCKKIKTITEVRDLGYPIFNVEVL